MNTKLDTKTDKKNKLKLLPVYTIEIPDGTSDSIITPVSYKYFVDRWIYLEEATDNPFY